MIQLSFDYSTTFLLKLKLENLFPYKDCLLIDLLDLNALRRIHYFKISTLPSYMNLESELITFFTLVQLMKCFSLDQSFSSGSLTQVVRNEIALLVSPFISHNIVELFTIFCIKLGAFILHKNRLVGAAFNLFPFSFG